MITPFRRDKPQIYSELATLKTLAAADSKREVAAAG